MAATVIDSLLITLGFDASGVQNVLQVVDGQIKNVGNIASQFTEGLKEGFDGSADGVKELAKSATEAGDAFKGAGEKGADAMDQVAQGAGRAEKKVKTLGDRAKALGKSLGSTLKRALTGWAAPLAGMFAVGALIKGYASDLAELDALTKKTSLSMEERTRKQKLLGEYSEKDLEQYQKTRKAIEDFTKKMKEGATAIFSSIVPALTWLLERITKLADYVKRHQPFFIAFFAGIATIITIALIPAIKKLEFTAVKAAWAIMKPFLPWIALVAALALVFDDLWVFMQGGDSIIGRLLKQFGASEETIESFREGVKKFFDILKEWAPYLAAFFGLFIARKAVWGVVAGGIGMVSKGIGVMSAAFGVASKAFGLATTAIKGVAAAIRLMGMAAMANPVILIIMAIIAAIALCIYYWDDIKSAGAEAWDYIAGKWGQAKEWFGSIVDGIKEKFQQFKDFLMGLIPDWLKDLLGIDGGKGFDATIAEVKSNLGQAISDALPSVDGILDGINGAGDAVKNFGSGLLDDAKGFFGGWFGSDASEGVNPALSAGPVDNSTSVKLDGGIQVYTQATDASGIAKDIGGAVERRMAATGNKGVRQ